MSGTEQAASSIMFGMYDHYVPGAKAGSYTLRVEGKLQANAQSKPAYRESQTLQFVLDAPRFRLEAKGEVHACSPPRGGNGDYARQLPHIVLQKRALPWERALDSKSTSADDRTLPWLALIVLTNDEVVADGARMYEMQAGDLVAPQPTLVGPRLDISAAEIQEMALVLELSSGLFRAVCPRIPELRSLVHVRRISVEDKHDGLGEHESNFAIVMANRLVQPGANLVLLVSLEGWREWLEKPNSDTTEQRVRVVVLHSWTFTCASGDHSFSAQIKSLDVAMHADHDTRVGDDAPALQSMLSRGYSPIAYEPDGAQRTIAWYRGPLAPVLDRPFESDRFPFSSADAALVLDEPTGMFEISLASAYQLGRLLALSSASFGKALMHWNHGKQRDAMENPDAPPRGFYLDEMSRYAASHQLDDEDATAFMDDVKVVSQWLTQLRRLRFVPFWYLVPAAELLPPESLRMFYLDTNWIDALTDGALSWGTSSLTTPWFHQAKRGDVRKYLEQLPGGFSSPNQSEVTTTENEVDVVRCGFLLRSALLQEFPGLEVECWKEGLARTKCPIVRMDMLEQDLLLMIVTGQPDEILFKLPREALTLSHDEAGLRPRITDPKNENVGKRAPNAAPLLVNDYLRQDTPNQGVLDVRKLHDKLETPGNMSGARFALHWVNSPDDVIVRWNHAKPGSVP